MGVLSRLLKVGEAHTNRLIDKFEKPEVMLEQAIVDRGKEIAQAREAVVKVIAAEKQTHLQLDQQLRQQHEWEERAEMALNAGREDLATQALNRVEELHNSIESLRALLSNQQEQSQKLKLGLQKMDGELAELKRNKNIILAQTKAAEARKSISKAQAKIGSSGSADLLERLRTKARDSALEATAMEELSDNSGDPLEKQFDDLSVQASASSVQKRLEEMKQRRLRNSN